jgi:hypothetical protein
LYSPAIPFCAASAIKTTTIKSDTDSEPASRRKIRNPATISKYITVARSTSSNTLPVGTNIVRQSIVVCVIRSTSASGLHIDREPYALIIATPPCRKNVRRESE